MFEAMFTMLPPVFNRCGMAAWANHAFHGRLAQCAGLVTQAASQAAHAVLAARGEWATNDKTLLTLAGLRQVDDLVADAHADPEAARRLVDVAEELCAAAMRAALGPSR